MELEEGDDVVEDVELRLRLRPWRRSWLGPQWLWRFCSCSCVSLQRPWLLGRFVAVADDQDRFWRVPARDDQRRERVWARSGHDFDRSIDQMKVATWFPADKVMAARGREMAS